ncbi:MAG: transporter substrate-binding domain-containing protein [Paracoccaceae bacterium]
MLRITISTVFAVLITVTGALACSAPHIVSQGDTLRAIAELKLGDASDWPQLIDANPNLQIGRSTGLTVGATLKIPCPERITQGSSVAPPKREVAEIRLLTGSNNAPFTDKKWPGQGMLSEVVNAAFEQSPSPVSHALIWDDDWSRHLFPLVDSKDFDMGFPWVRPDCEQNPEQELCVRFHFSDALIDLAILLFVRADDPIQFEQDRDLVGHKICRPNGYFTHDLDRIGREWVSQGKITLIQPETAEACFELLAGGDVDAVAVNEFLGAQKLHAMDLQGTIVPIDRPLSIQGLHVVISKTHWRGTSHLYRFNAGLRALKETDRYREIVNRHLSLFWDEVKE